MSQIVPYFVGRGIWFWPNGSNSKHDEQACAAIVTFLHSDRLVNIAYFTPAGEVRSRENVVAMQPGDQWPADGSAFVCFVPAQAAQVIEVPDEAPAAANEVYDLIDENGDIVDSVYSLSAAEDAVDAGDAVSYKKDDNIGITTRGEVEAAQVDGEMGAGSDAPQPSAPQSIQAA